MSRYNLLREPWISVIIKGTGEQKDVSLLDIFRNTQDYLALAGDMKTQDFAVLRLLLSILHTVFSRYDENGNSQPGIVLDEKMKQSVPVDEDDIEEYMDAEEDTWNRIWNARRFPNIVCEYLEKWEDRFFLFDEKYPFYQCTKEEIENRLPVGKKLTQVAGRNIKRTISESGNKIALFSPQAENNKDLMTEAELTRWLIMMQNYMGLSDKTSLFGKDRQPSKGWLFDLGGLYLEGNDLFETLMMNYIPVHSETRYNGEVQTPCWELGGEKNLERLIASQDINDLAGLYTNWARALNMDPCTDVNKPIQVGIAKLPALRHSDQFLEPMTVWRFNQTGDMKDHFTPRKHLQEQAIWRSFGLITLENSVEKHQRRPEILKQYERVQKVAGNRNIILRAVSMKDDGNATSWVPTDEIIDVLRLNDIVISDTGKSGWVVRINGEVENTKTIVERIYGGLLTDIANIRGLDPQKEGKTYIQNGKKELYQRIDEPFREWIESIQPENSMDVKMLQWQKECRDIILAEAQDVLEKAGERDYRGIIEKEGRVINIYTAYLSFRRRLKKFNNPM